MIGSRWILCVTIASLISMPTSELPAQATAVKEGVASANELSAAFRAVARETLPAVVSVKTRVQGRQISLPQGQRNPLEEEMLKRFFPDFGGLDQPRYRNVPPQEGQGSGFVIDSSGIILTNSHVVSGADRVTVQFQDGAELVADSWKTDPWSDVAIVRVKPEQPLMAIPLGNSNPVEIGDWVLALGDPFGVGTSVTAGIISGKGRAPHINEREDFLQTDAAINPGNSGGPLVNLSGEVIGINTAISTRSGGYDGVGFAIPVHLAKWVAQQLIDKGKVERPYLGVLVQPLTADLRKQFGIGVGQGALVAQTVGDGPAQQAGIRSGDVILDIGGQQVSNSVRLQGIVERLEIGKTYPVNLLRDGERTTIDVELAEMPEKFGRNQTSSSDDEKPEPESSASERLGIDVADLTGDVRESLGLEDSVEGVVITSVDPTGPSAEKGVAVGEVVLRVGTTTVSSVADFNAALESTPGRTGVLLLLQSGRGTRFIVVEPRE